MKKPLTVSWPVLIAIGVFVLTAINIDQSRSKPPSAVSAQLDTTPTTDQSSSTGWRAPLVVQNICTASMNSSVPLPHTIDEDASFKKRQRFEAATNTFTVSSTFDFKNHFNASIRKSYLCEVKVDVVTNQHSLVSFNLVQAIN